MVYNSSTLSFLFAWRRASLSCEVAQCMPSWRMRLFSDICSLLNLPSFLISTRTHSSNMATATAAIVMSTSLHIQPAKVQKKIQIRKRYAKKGINMSKYLILFAYVEKNDYLCTLILYIIGYESTCCNRETLRQSGCRWDS